MKTFTHQAKLIAVLVLSIFLLGSCSEGGGELPRGDASTGAPFTGRMVGTRTFDNTLIGVDLNNGRFSDLPGNGYLDAQGILNPAYTIKVSRDRSIPSGMLATVDDCSEQVNDITCFLFLDRSGNLTGQFDKEADFAGPGKVSFDGTHVAVNLSDRVGGLSTMTIYTRDGAFVSNHSQSGSSSSSGPYDWLPDGRVVYSIEGNELLGDAQPTGFIISNPYSAIPDRRITLPEYYQGGRIDTIESSPDGSQLLISVSPRVGPRRPILLDLESLRTTQLVDRTQLTATAVLRPVWGPAGRWVYAAISTSELLSGTALDNSQGEQIVFIGRSESLFAFEVNGTRHPMPTGQNALSESLRLIPTDSPTNQGSEIGGGKYDGNLVWIP